MLSAKLEVWTHQIDFMQNLVLLLLFDTSLVIGALATLATTGTRLILTFVCSSCGSSLLPQVEEVLFKST